MYSHLDHEILLLSVTKADCFFSKASNIEAISSFLVVKLMQREDNSSNCLPSKLQCSLIKNRAKIKIIVRTEKNIINFLSPDVILKFYFVKKKYETREFCLEML